MNVLDELGAGPQLQLRPERVAADQAVISSAVGEAASLSPGARQARVARRLWIGPFSLRLSVAGLVLGGVVAAGGVAAAVVVLTPTRPTVLGVVRCYTEVSTDFGASFPGSSLASALPAGSSTPVDEADQAISDCGALWQQGFLVAGSSGIDASGGHADNPVPPLAVCVLPSGEAAVFPGGPETCANLGLPVMAPPAGAGTGSGGTSR